MRTFHLERDEEKLVGALIDLRMRKSKKVRSAVDKIRKKVLNEGEKAIVELCKYFDGWEKEYPLKLEAKEILDGASSVSKEDESVLRGMIERVRSVHEVEEEKRVIAKEDLYVEEDLVPVERVLIYAPGGRASYPSSLIMAAVPAILASVKEIYVTTPAPNGKPNPYILKVCELLGLERVFRIGGAQAIFAFAYGTGRIPKVDMIVGPGNAYVEEAKRQCFGLTGIDGIAGPTELMIFVKDEVFPDLIAKDILSQAEHDIMSMIWVLFRSKGYIAEVISEIKRILKGAERRDILDRVLKERTFLIRYEDEEKAVDFANRVAPEHLELIGDPSLAKKFLYPGIVYVGIETPVSLGDYYIGTNHILPTSGAGRFQGGLSVHSFKRRRLIVRTEIPFVIKYASKAKRMAEIEGLFGHGEAIISRKEKRHEIEDWISKGKPSGTDI